MAYRTKVEVRSKGRVFKPGAILPNDISPADLSFLKKKKFIELVDAAAEVVENIDDTADDEGAGDDGFNEMLPGEYKSAEEIRKFRKKKDVYAYAQSIGLDLGEDFEERSLNDLCDEVINYQDERESEAE